MREGFLRPFFSQVWEKKGMGEDEDLFPDKFLKITLSPGGA
jgi:hypothetical protein